MSRRVNVTETTDPEYYEGPTGTRVAGWFDIDKATAYEEDTEWDGNNRISKATGSQWDHQILYRTAKGRWVLHCWSQYQGSTPSYEFVTDEVAREWLIAQNEDGAVREHFGELEEERGPGRPEVGGAVHLRLGDLLPVLDTYAAGMALNRAEAARKLLAQALQSAGMKVPTE